MPRPVRAAIFAILVLTGCNADGVTTPTPLNGVEERVVFVTMNATPNRAMEALVYSQVTLDARGCLRLASSQPATVVWPKGFALVERGTDLWITDAAGRDVGRIGGTFKLAGGYIDSLFPDIPLSDADRRRATDSCPGQYWIVSDVLQP